MRRPALLRPRRLAKGGVIGVCAPAGPVMEPAALECNLGWLRSAGYTVRCSPSLRARRGYLAGSDDERQADLLGLVRDPAVDAIVLARGGYGVGRFLRRLDPAEFRAARKPVVGYSDATLLLGFLREHAGLLSIHGPMLERDDSTPEARARLLALLGGERAALEPIAGEPLVPGVSRGPLVGGSLTMLAASLGTPWEIDTRRAILFLEDVNEAPYAIDRKLVQLREAGKLDALAGVAVGRLVGCTSERYPDVSAGDVVRELLVPEVRGPIVTELPFGHVADHRALGFGVRAELDGGRGTLRLIEPVVEDGG
jgi:muramoyltetrapeptide carboxypeptidase